MPRPRTIWRGLEVERQFFTPYQRFDFLGSWQRQVGARENLSPFIVIAYDAERRPLLLLPLALRRSRGVRTACFMGGKHTTFNMALWDRDFAKAATRADLDALIAAIARARRGRRSGAEPAAAALAGSGQPDGAVAEAAVGQRLPATDDGSRCRAGDPDQATPSAAG